MTAFPFRCTLTMMAALSLSACTQAPDKPADAGSLPSVATTQNTLSITRDNHITWNGTRVTEVQLASLLKQSKALPAEPELQFQPDVGADYDVSARVLQIIKESGATKFGFVGNEMYVTPDKAPAP